MADLNDMTDWGRLQEMLAKKSTGATTRIDEAEFLAHLRSRVKGQDAILQEVAKLIRLQALKQQRDKPIANLMFLGPTGTGKTELAKAIAEYLFKDEKAMIRFEGGELTSDFSKNRLIGMPTGYVGADKGGDLTRPVMSNPRRVILFDEIDKAHRDIADLFLGLMGEGRVTEQGSGKTADFTQCIIILTSNLHHEEIGEIQKQVTDYNEMVNAVKKFMAESKDFRPEILGRIDRVYAFKPLEGMVIAEIAVLKLSKLAKQYGLNVRFVAPELIMQALIASEKRSGFGARELERIISEMFSEQLADAKDAGASEVELSLGDNGEVIVHPALRQEDTMPARPPTHLPSTEH